MHTLHLLIFYLPILHRVACGMQMASSGGGDHMTSTRAADPANSFSSKNVQACCVLAALLTLHQAPTQPGGLTVIGQNEQVVLTNPGTVAQVPVKVNVSTERASPGYARVRGSSLKSPSRVSGSSSLNICSGNPALERTEPLITYRPYPDARHGRGNYENGSQSARRGACTQPQGRRTGETRYQEGSPS